MPGLDVAPPRTAVPERCGPQGQRHDAEKRGSVVAQNIESEPRIYKQLNLMKRCTVTVLRRRCGFSSCLSCPCASSAFLGGVGGGGVSCASVCTRTMRVCSTVFCMENHRGAARARANGLWYVHLQNEHALTMWHVQQKKCKVCVAPDTSRKTKKSPAIWLRPIVPHWHEPPRPSS